MKTILEIQDKKAKCNLFADFILQKFPEQQSLN